MREFFRMTVIVLLLVTTVCSQNRRAPVSKQNQTPGKQNLLIRYIANEGVLISAGGKTVLIDALHREYKPDYLFPPADLLQALENARAPYDKIDLLLVSHVHLDHFHPLSVGLHLKNNPRAALISSAQVIDEIAKNFADYERVKSQIKIVTHEWKKIIEFDQEGIKIKFLGLRHGSERFRSIQNLGHVIEIGGQKLLHIGDADLTDENFSAFNLAKEKIDITFIPYWFLLSESGRALVKEQFNPRQIIAVHISPAEAEKVAAGLKKELPEVIAFTKILEERSF